MMPLKSQTIDELKKEYEYKIDPLNFIDTSFVIFGLFWGHFMVKFKEYYRFNEKIKEIKIIIDNKRDNISKNTLDSYEKTLKDISDGCEKIKKKAYLVIEEMSPIIGGICLDYKRNKDQPGAADIYQKISTELIDKVVKTFIELEKILISYDEHIISIKKNLIN